MLGALLPLFKSGCFNQTFYLVSNYYTEDKEKFYEFIPPAIKITWFAAN